MEKFLINIDICENLIVEFFQKSCTETVYSGEYKIIPTGKEQEDGEGFIGNKSIFKISLKNKKFTYSGEKSVKNSKLLFEKLKTTNFN